MNKKLLLICLGIIGAAWGVGELWRSQIPNPHSMTLGIRSLEERNGTPCGVFGPIRGERLMMAAYLHQTASVPEGTMGRVRVRDAGELLFDEFVELKSLADGSRLLFSGQRVMLRREGFIEVEAEGLDERCVVKVSYHQR